MRLRTSILTAILTAWIVGVTAACGGSTPTAVPDPAQAPASARRDGGGMYGSGNLSTDPAASHGGGGMTAADSIEAAAGGRGGGMYGSGN